MTHNYRVQLHRLLVERLVNEDELRTLCFDLGINCDDLPGTGMAAKARELILNLEKRKRLPELVQAAAQLRPDVNWVSVFDAVEHKERDNEQGWPGTELQVQQKHMRPSLKLKIGAAIGIVFVVALTGGYLLSFRLIHRNAPSYQSTPVELRVERPTISLGECTTLFWRAPGYPHVRIQGLDLNSDVLHPPISYHQVCPRYNAVYELLSPDQRWLAEIAVSVISIP